MRYKHVSHNNIITTLGEVVAKLNIEFYWRLKLIPRPEITRGCKLNRMETWMKTQLLRRTCFILFRYFSRFIKRLKKSRPDKFFVKFMFILWYSDRSWNELLRLKVGFIWYSLAKLERNREMLLILVVWKIDLVSLTIAGFGYLWKQHEVRILAPSIDRLFLPVVFVEFSGYLCNKMLIKKQ